MELFLYGLCIIALAILVVHLIHRPIPGLSRYLPAHGAPDSSAASTPTPTPTYRDAIQTMFQRQDSFAEATRASRVMVPAGVATSSAQVLLSQQPYN